MRYFTVSGHHSSGRRVAACIACLMLVLSIVTGCSQQAAQSEDANAKQPTRLYLVGDSTLSKKIPERAPETGWGMALADLAKPQLTVENHAVNGRSTKSFIDEGRWQVVRDQLQQGDHVLIQFGHNDQKQQDPARYAAPFEGYSDNLRLFVQQAREQGASPILATSICRRHFDDQGNLETTHGDYPAAMRAVAKDLDVPLIDLRDATCESLQSMGPGATTSLYLHVKPGEYAYYKDGKIDNTHLSPKGALWVARMFIERLQEKNHPLANYFHEGVPAMPQQLDAIKLWPSQPPVAAKAPGTERMEDNRVYNVREPVVIPRLAPADSENGTGVLVFPGGGYQRLAIDKEAVAVADWLNSHGIHAFIVKYRMQEFGAPAPLLDAQQAMRLVRSRANEWRLHPNKIGVIGFSAGGHLAASLLTHYQEDLGLSPDGALTEHSARPDFGMLIYPVITMREAHTHSGSRTALLGDAPSPQQLAFYSLEEQVHQDVPPVFLVHGGNDESVPVENSLAFYRALHDAGVPAEMLIYNNAPHGIGLLAGYQQASNWPQRALEWLESIRMVNRE